MEQYLNLTQLSNPSVQFSDHNRVSFASSYLQGSAAMYWYNLATLVNVPTTWDEFKRKLTSEFIPADHAQRARDKLRKRRQIGSVEKFLAEYRNIVLMIPEISGGEKLDRFVEGLKYDVIVEVLKSSRNSFEEAVHMALSIHSAIWRAKKGTGAFSPVSTHSKTPTPMEIGNINGRSGSSSERERRKKDVSKNACFRCHNSGCRPWKCSPSRVNNIKVDNDDLVSEGNYFNKADSESEN